MMYLNFSKLAFISVLSIIAVFMVVDTAQAIAINKCVRLLRDSQVGRETIVNSCQKCVVAKLERRRSTGSGSAPTLREFTLPLKGSSLMLPFRGPGKTRLLGEKPCGQPR